jgi:hypothetical protein
MTKEQLIGKFARLRAELVDAHARRLDPSHLERLMDELTETRRLVAEFDGHGDEQTGDSAFKLGW